MFHSAKNFEGRGLEYWDVSNVENFKNMFLGARSFQEDVGRWDVSSATNTNGMFMSSAFNSDISMWDVRQVTDISYMFSDTIDFDQSLAGWQTSSIVEMESVF